MITPEEILNELAVENMINIHKMVTTKDLVILAIMRYARLYHENEIKNQKILNVSIHCPIGKINGETCYLFGSNGCVGCPHLTDK